MLDPVNNNKDNSKLIKIAYAFLIISLALVAIFGTASWTEKIVGFALCLAIGVLGTWAQIYQIILEFNLDKNSRTGAAVLWTLMALGLLSLIFMFYVLANIQHSVMPETQP